jgi:hypothetical protein
MRLLLILACAAAALACDTTPRNVTGNWAADLYGEMDTRPGTWGRQDSVVKQLRFTAVPPGCTVEILTLRGDLVTWPKNDSLRGGKAGTLLAIQKEGPEGSTRADYAEDKTLLYIQLPSAAPARAPFHTDVVDGVLPTNVLEFKLATWLNTTGSPIHIEATWTIVFRYRPRQEEAPNAYCSSWPHRR